MLQKLFKGDNQTQTSSILEANSNRFDKIKIKESTI